MGIINHNAVIATTWSEVEVTKIRKWVNSIKKRKSFLFGEPTINGFITVILIPDGSKEGWDESDDGDRLRDDFVYEIQKATYEDGSTPWDWIEVGFGEYGQKILRGNCKNMYGDEEYGG